MQKGFVLTVTLIFLVVVLIIVIAFLDMIRVHLTSTTYRANREKGVYLAEAGLEQKLLQLKLDLINSASNVYDAFNETWASGIGDTNGSLNDSEGVSLGSGKYQVLKGFIDGAAPPDTFQNLSDEQGKVNINYVETNYANGRYNSLTLSNLLRVTNGALSKSDAITKAENIVSYRYGTDGKPGFSGVDDNCNGEICITANGADAKLGIEYDGMDNDGDGTIDEIGEGIDEPDEFNPSQPYGDDNPFDSIEEIKKVTNITETDYNNIKDYITVYSLANSNSLYANEKTGLSNFYSSTGYRAPYALAPRITRSAVPRAPVNINTASLPVLKVVLWNEDVTPIGTPPAVITLIDTDSVARSIMDQRNGADNLHGTSDDNPFDS
ncbi:MAG: general secretion pathway protein GspK, partial [Candidatus Omnitrophica bacterium]|nr:general secretion pathway protein GspK [Candidatus Omnitrophota bacterium]